MSALLNASINHGENIITSKRVEGGGLTDNVEGNVLMRVGYRR